MTNTMISAIAPDQRFNQSLVFSSQHKDWNGILVHHYQNARYLIETEVPAQMLAIHLLRHYSTVTRPVTSKNRNLTRTQLQQAIDYIHVHLDRDLSLAELAGVVNLSPAYFASLFKQAIGISPHQYVIQQRVERAKVMLTKTDLAIRATHRLRQRRHCLTSGFLQPKPFNGTLQAVYWHDPKTDSLIP